MPQSFRFPDNSHRTTIIGKTGTGKTVFAFWLLTQSRFDEQPYIVLDFKHDPLIGRSDRIREIGLSEKLPTAPGVYVVRPHPMDDEEEVEKWLWKVWSHENIGLWIDEGYSISPRSRALKGVLTQGRSKHIPVIMLTQRPSWISRFVFSEADFFAYFQVTDKNDIQRVQQMIPQETLNLYEIAPKYHARWYDVGEGAAFMLRPVPTQDKLLDMLDARLSPKTRYI